MSKKEALHQQKMSRNDRFAQMSHQEKIIEQKKKEILAKLEAKKKITETAPTENASKLSAEAEKKSLNVFHNDGSFLNTFKNLKEKKVDSKHKSFKPKDYGDDRGNKLSKWGQKQNCSSKDRSKPINRLPDKNPNFEQQKITINTCFKNSMNQHDFNSHTQIIPETETKPPVPPIVKTEEITPPNTIVPIPSGSQMQTIIAPQRDVHILVPQPILIGVPPAPTHNIIMPSDSLNLEPVTIESFVPNQIPVPPACLPTVELANIPPPNPIQVQNIPQPAPIQVQNIPTPTSLQLNEIPNPKPLDLMAIPTPSENNLSDAEFLKNIPPPNRSVPPPSLGDATLNIPPPPPSNCISMVNIQPQASARNIPTSSSLLLHGIQTNQQIQNTQQNNFGPMISVALPSSTINVSNAIPALMAQPILPPPGTSLNTVNISCPPPLLTMNTPTVQLQAPPPGYLGQAPPSMRQMQKNIPPPPPVMSSAGGSNTPDMHGVFPPGTADYEAMASLARMVAQCGPSVQEVVQQRKKQDPSLWFLFHKESAAYKQYQQLIEQFKREMQEESQANKEYKPEEAYEPEGACKEDDRTRDFYDNSNSSQRKRRRSRWGEKIQDMPNPNVIPPVAVAVPIVPLPMNQQPGQIMLSKITRTDPALLQYVKQTFNTLNLTEEEWKKAEDNYKINLLYQDMVRKKEEAAKNKFKYEYDSDEETEGGTWEHKMRQKEMMATEQKANELTRQAEGKHHIGDFLPPEEFKRFMEKANAAKEGKQLNFSDYNEFKIKEDNKGFKMLQKLGWTEGSGLGSEGTGIVEPVNKATSRDLNQGLGLNSEEFDNDDDEYESYRKRMMLAYRFRPNPWNNPRRPYY